MSAAVVPIVQLALVHDSEELLYRQMSREFRAYKMAMSRGEEVARPAYDEATLCRFWEWQRQWLTNWVSNL